MQVLRVPEHEIAGVGQLSDQPRPAIPALPSPRSAMGRADQGTDTDRGSPGVSGENRQTVPMSASSVLSHWTPNWSSQIGP